MSDPIEKWKGEFESSVKITKEYMCAMDFIKNHIFDTDENGNYKTSDTNTLWQGFLMAKRSTPVVELPRPYIEWDYDENPIKYWTKRQLDEAGINYRIKGE